MRGRDRTQRGGALALRLAALLLAAAGLLACRGQPERGGAPVPVQPERAGAQPGSATPASNDAMNSPASAPRPALRRLMAAHPDTVARQLPPDNAARVRAYLQSHAVPAEIARAIEAHEIWIGMTEEEVILSVGPATSREALPDRPGGHALVYAGEGWVLRFDAGGFLYELVER